MNGETIREIRQWLNLTQEEFSELMNMSSNYISKLERGIETPSPKFILQLIDLIYKNLEQENTDEINSLLTSVARNPLVRSILISYLLDGLTLKEQDKLFKIIYYLISLLDKWLKTLFDKNKRIIRKTTTS